MKFVYRNNQNKGSHKGQNDDTMQGRHGSKGDDQRDQDKDNKDNRSSR